jgi:hypothetical protein
LLAAGIGRRLTVVLQVREAMAPQHLVLDIRLPFGVANDELIRITPTWSEASRVTFE